jgi:predicted ATPase
MGFYSLNPDRIRDLQPPDQGELLQRDGANLAAVLGRLTTDAPDAKALVEQYLGRVVPGVVGVDPRVVGPKETLEYRQQVRGARAPWRFYAANMSDGTLRATGVLVALFQGHRNGSAGGRLIGIEEPEVALHPAAAGVLLEALRRASSRVQVLVTSHSPELLDDESIGTDELLAVTSEEGETRVGPLDERTRSILRDRLYTAGELLRMDQLIADPELAQPNQLSLFGGEAVRDEDPSDR